MAPNCGHDYGLSAAKIASEKALDTIENLKDTDRMTKPGASENRKQQNSSSSNNRNL